MNAAERERALVSVIIPTYNRAYCIENAIDSVLNQTHREVEVVVVDDGSSDGTRDLLAARYGADERVKYFHRENGGVSAARNAGLSRATGDFIALLDSDDVWKPWKLELQLACFRDVPEAGMVWTDMEAVDLDGKVFDPKFLRTMYSAYQWFPGDTLFSESHALPEISVSLPEGAGRLFAGSIYSQMIMGNLVHTSTVLLRRERFEKVREFNEELRYSGEDYDFHLRTCREGVVAFAAVASIAYTRGMPDQLTGSAYQIYRARNFLKTIEPHILRDRGRIKLPQHMIDFVLSDAHYYVGESALEIGELAEARAHLFKTLRYRLWQPRAAALFLLSLFPLSVGKGLRGLYRGAKASVRPGGQTG